jgi:hypothetical protein
MPNEPCPYFSVQSAEVPTPRTPIVIHAPVCRMAQQMADRLNTVPEGQTFVKLLTVRPEGKGPRIICGPDLNPTTSLDCTHKRLQDECIPSFVRILRSMALDAALPPETAEPQ